MASVTPFSNCPVDAPCGTKARAGVQGKAPDHAPSPRPGVEVGSQVTKVSGWLPRVAGGAAAGVKVEGGCGQAGMGQGGWTQTMVGTRVQSPWDIEAVPVQPGAESQFFYSQILQCLAHINRFPELTAWT